MKWPQIRGAIRANVLARPLKKPRLQLSALDSLDTLLTELFPDFQSNPGVLLNVGKEGVTSQLARLKTTSKLSGAEKTILNRIFARLNSPVSSANTKKKRHKLHSPDAATEGLPVKNARQAAINVKSGLPPVVWESSRTLILGTMPGDESLRKQRYYANPSNKFWLILSKVYGEPNGTDYGERLERAYPLDAYTH